MLRLPCHSHARILQRLYQSTVTSQSTWLIPKSLTLIFLWLKIRVSDKGAQEGRGWLCWWANSCRPALASKGHLRACGLQNRLHEEDVVKGTCAIAHRILGDRWALCTKQSVHTQNTHQWQVRQARHGRGMSHLCMSHLHGLFHLPERQISLVSWSCGSAIQLLQGNNGFHSF